MTWGECERYCEFYYSKKKEDVETIFKLFAFHNLESSRLAQFGKPSMINSYVSKLRKNDEIKDNDLDEQFQGVNFE